MAVLPVRKDLSKVQRESASARSVLATLHQIRTAQFVMHVSGAWHIEARLMIFSYFNFC
jgi:hypothetical protein